MTRLALGLIETTGLTGAIRATHAATKAGEIAIASAEKCESGGITVKIEGDWDTVQAAVEAGARAADEVDELISMHVIPRPDSAVSTILPYQRFLDRFRPAERPTTPIAPARSRPRKTDESRRVTTPTGATRPTLPRSPQPKEIKPARPVPTPTAVAPKPTDIPQSEISWQQLEGMAVVKLRKYARTLVGLSIKGREISKGNKQQLLAAIRELRQQQAE